RARADSSVSGCVLSNIDAALALSIPSRATKVSTLMPRSCSAVRIVCEGGDAHRGANGFSVRTFIPGSVNLHESHQCGGAVPRSSQGRLVAVAGGARD